jgi:hypothetical protein
MNLNIPLVVNNVVQPATLFPGGTGVLSAAASVFPTSVAVQVLLPDGVTFFTTTLTLSANGITAGVALPPGKVQALVTGSPTGLFANLQLVPTNLN